MSMSIASESDGEDEVISAINTTPLVDVMLVLLIIFLITIPAIVQNVAVVLPAERNIVTQTKPENIVISVNKAMGQRTAHHDGLPVASISCGKIYI